MIEQWQREAGKAVERVALSVGGAIVFRDRGYRMGLCDKYGSVVVVSGLLDPESAGGHHVIDGVVFDVRENTANVTGWCILADGHVLYAEDFDQTYNMATIDQFEMPETTIVP